MRIWITGRLEFVYVGGNMSALRKTLEGIWTDRKCRCPLNIVWWRLEKFDGGKGMWGYAEGHGVWWSKGKRYAPKQKRIRFPWAPSMRTAFKWMDRARKRLRYSGTPTDDHGDLLSQIDVLSTQNRRLV